MTTLYYDGYVLLGDGEEIMKQFRRLSTAERSKSRIGSGVNESEKGDGLPAIKFVRDFTPEEKKVIEKGLKERGLSINKFGNDYQKAYFYLKSQVRG